MSEQNEISRDPACADGRGASPAPNLETGAGGAIPADGFYNATVQCLGGDCMHLCVEVRGGRVFKANHVELKPEACSEYVPVSAWSYCSVWPVHAGTELETLRAENATLKERLGKYQHEFRIAIIRAERAEEQVRRLEEAGDKLASELRGHCHNLGADRLLDNWGMAKGQT